MISKHKYTLIFNLQQTIYPSLTVILNSPYLFNNFFIYFKLNYFSWHCTYQITIWFCFRVLSYISRWTFSFIRCYLFLLKTYNLIIIFKYYQVMFRKLILYCYTSINIRLKHMRVRILNFITSPTSLPTKFISQLRPSHQKLIKYTPWENP